MKSLRQLAYEQDVYDKIVQSDMLERSKCYEDLVSLLDVNLPSDIPQKAIEEVSREFFPR